MQTKRLEQAEIEIGKALMARGDAAHRRQRVLVCVRHLIAWLAETEGIAQADEFDPEVESSRHG